MTLREEVIELGRRLTDAGWRFTYDDVIRPDDLREHDEEAIEVAEDLLGYELPSFLKEFALQVGAIFLLGRADEGSRLATVFPSLTTAEGAADSWPLLTIPLPGGLDELEMAIEEEFDPGIPIIEDSYTAIDVSGGPPLCILFDEKDSESTELFVDLDPDSSIGIDFEGYLRRCLSQGGFYQLPEDLPEAREFLLELGSGLGEFR